MLRDEPDAAAEAVYAAIKRIGRDAACAGLAGPDSRMMMGKILQGSAAADPGLQDGAGLARIATVLLHFALSAAAVPSQRKAEFGGVQIDIAVPGLRRLAQSPKDVLIIWIPEARDEGAQAQLERLRAVQPVRENIWAVSQGLNLPCKTYRVRGPGLQASALLDDARRFASERGRGSLGLLGSHPKKMP